MRSSLSSCSNNTTSSLKKPSEHVGIGNTHTAGFDTITRQQSQSQHTAGGKQKILNEQVVLTKGMN